MKLLILLLAAHQCLAADNIISPSSVETLVAEVDKLENQALIKLEEYAIKILLGVVDTLLDVLFPPTPLPTFNETIWWGKGSPEDQDSTIRPYTIKFKEEKIQSIKNKLSNREEFQEPLIDANFTYGMNSVYLNKVLDYWQTNYNFTARQERLNSFPQYIVNVQGLDIHYFHIKPNPNTKKKVVPLMMLHGWPVSNMEFLYLYPNLTKEREGRDFVFEVIAPSIPGYGYSQGTSKVGFSSYQAAIVLKNFMRRLGFQRFFLSAGDVGQITADHLSTIYQDDVLGLHTNLPYNVRIKTGVKYLIGALFPSLVVEPKYADRMYPITSVLYYLVRYFGYFHMHATKPDTVSIALQDSPAGLASWILTIMSWTSNPAYDNLADGGLIETFKIDDLIDLLTIMWDSGALSTSVRYYAECYAIIQDPTIITVTLHPTKVPYSVIKFRHEIAYQPDNFLKDKYPNLVHSTTLDYGGHFAGFENPDVLQADIWDGVAKMIEFNEKNSRG